MLQDSKVFSSYSVDDIDKARDFYHNILGLEVKDNPIGLLELHITNDNPVVVYPKPNHVPANFTVLNFQVNDINQAVDQLTSKGVTFEKYEGEIATDEKGISHGGVSGKGPNIAWFKDPAGNILSVMEG